MLAPTHVIGGQFAYLSAAWWVGHEPALAEALVAGAAALAPDLDSRSGVVGRWVPWLSGAIEHWVGHRTATHSVLALVAVIALSWQLPAGFTMAVVAGFASHALLDMMTPGGVAWFWPARARCVLPGDARWRMEAMGKGELVFAVVLAVLTWPTLVAADRGVGLLGSVRDAIGDVAQARQHYDAHKSEAAWWLKVDGQDNRAYAPVEGRYRVIGPYRSDGLIVETPDGPRTVCRADACDWYAGRAVLERGEVERTTTRRISAESAATDDLLAALEPLREAGRVYLLGELRGESLRSDEPTVQVSGDRARLRFATPAQLEKQGEGLESVELTIQVRHQPGREVPEPGPLAVSESDGIDERLRRYLP